MSKRIVADIDRALEDGRLEPNFRAADVRRACPGWGWRTFNVFLPKHRLGNPGGNSVLFVQNSDGTYSRVPEGSIYSRLRL